MRYYVTTGVRGTAKLQYCNWLTQPVKSFSTVCSVASLSLRSIMFSFIRDRLSCSAPIFLSQAALVLTILIPKTRAYVQSLFRLTLGW